MRFAKCQPTTHSLVLQMAYFLQQQFYSTTFPLQAISDWHTRFENEMLKKYRESKIKKFEMATLFSVSWQTEFLHNLKLFREYMRIRFDKKIEDILTSYEKLVKDFCFSVLDISIEGSKYYATSAYYDVVRNMSLWRVPVRGCSIPQHGSFRNLFSLFCWLLSCWIYVRKH